MRLAVWGSVERVVCDESDELAVFDVVDRDGV